MRCCEAGSALARRSGGVIDKTPMEVRAVKDARRPLAAVLVELDGKRWYKTGDKGHLDEDGFLTIVDRYSRFAKIAGEMISLAAVENTVTAVLADESVSCLAVNIPDGKKGERIVLLYTGEMDPDELRRRMLSSNVLALMLPAEYVQLDALPVLGTGKVDLLTARKLAAEAMAGIV